MNGKRMFTQAVLLLCGAAPLTAAGCYEYKDLVDPCWPQRYNNMARNEVSDAFAAQVNKGHMLDQTVWTYDFEPGTDKLNAMGLDHLMVLAQRLPQPDAMIFIQTAQLPGDLTYDAANPEKLSATRAELDSKRGAAVQKFLMAQTGGHYEFQVAVVDPYEVRLPSVQVGTSIVQMYSAAKGTLTGANPVSGASGGGGGSSGGGGGR
jgi:hypothetical protein